MKQMELSVVAPVYNEEEGIEPVVRYWVEVLEREKIDAEIVLANDGSTDGTLAILEKLQKEIPILRVVSYTPNRGYGYALKTAIHASTGELVVCLDSDGQFDLADFPKLLKLYREQNLDFVTGFRDRKKDSLMRVIADRSLNLIVRTMFHLKLRDTNCALKLMKGSLIRSLTLEATGYPTPTEITIKMLKSGARTGETAVVHRERAAGQSKLKFMKTSISMFRFLLYLRKRMQLHESRIIQYL